MVRRAATASTAIRRLRRRVLGLDVSCESYWCALVFGGHDGSEYDGERGEAISGAIVRLAALDNGPQQLAHRAGEPVGEPAALQWERRELALPVELQPVSAEHRPSSNAGGAVNSERMATGSCR